MNGPRMTRRQVLTAAAGLSWVACAGGAPPVQHVQKKGGAPAAGASSDEELARIFEDAPRDRALRVAAEQLKAGRSQQLILDALTIAAARQIRPRPYLGPAFHAVMMLPATQTAAAKSGAAPLLWAIDNFKESQERDRAEGGVPFGVAPAAPAGMEISRALDEWDEENADRAIVALHKNSGREEVFRRLWKYGARDYRDIGHKSILLAGAWQLTKTMPWKSAQPLLRSVALGLLHREEAKKPDLEWQRNHELLATPGPATAPIDALSFLATLRASSEDEAVRAAAALRGLRANHAPIWEAIHLFSMELAIRLPDNIVALHAVTTAAALDAIRRAAPTDKERELVLLHAVGRAVAFSDYAKNIPAKGSTPAVTCPIDQLEPTTSDKSPLDLIRSGAGEERSRAVLATLKNPGGREQVFAVLRQTVLTGADESHDYKLSEAVFDQLEHLSPNTAALYLAASAVRFPRDTGKPSERSERIRAYL
jgi:hypothetical protein